MEEKSELENFLAHHGIKGMKWGVRKSKDGTYKPTAHVLREEAAVSRTGNKGRFSVTNPKNGKTASMTYNAKRVNIEQKDGLIKVQAKTKRELNIAMEDLKKLDKKVSQKSDVTFQLEMTDDQIRDAITRMELERRYNQLSKPHQKDGVLQDFLVKTGSQIISNVTTQVGTDIIKTAIGVNYNRVVKEPYRIGKNKK